MESKFADNLKKVQFGMDSIKYIGKMSFSLRVKSPYKYCVQAIAPRKTLLEAGKRLLRKRGDPEHICAKEKYVLFPTLNNRENFREETGNELKLTL